MSDIPEQDEVASKYHDTSPVATQAEGVVFFPGGARRGVVVTMTFAETTVLKKGRHEKGHEGGCTPLTCLPIEVSPRASRRL
jgi:hypothetical protein